jgi:hypothetical protein
MQSEHFRPRMGSNNEQANLWKKRKWSQSETRTKTDEGSRKNERSYF